MWGFKKNKKTMEQSMQEFDTSLKRLEKLLFDTVKNQTEPLKPLPRLTLEDYQRDVEKLAEFRELYNSDKFQRMLMVLHTLRPKGQDEKRSADFQLGYIRGYESVLTLIWLMTRPPEATKPQMEEDYGQEKVLKQWS